MTKINAKNEKIKNKYYEYLQENQGFSQNTIAAIKKAIYRYEEFSDFEDFSKFSKKKAVEFKAWLEAKKDPRTKKQISITTCYHYLRSLKDFFKWLSYQPSYKSKINMTEVEFLRLPKEKARIAVASKREHYPTMEQVRHVISSIYINNEIDLRDRALLSFTLLSGMRDKAIITLPLGCFNENTLQISQDPKKGVATKFSKTIHSVLFEFDSDMLSFVLDWVRFLKTEKLFGNFDPLFPRNKLENQENIKKFVSNSVEPYFWQSATSIRNIFKERFEQAGVEYFSPHTFRHLAVNMAIAGCRNGQEIKAVSQNFGHEDVGTTMTTYGSLSNTQVANTIANMDFSAKNTGSQADLLAKFQEFLKIQNGGSF